MQKFKIPHRFQLKSIIEYYAQWIREGKLKVNSAWNKRKIKFTVQDPCQMVRKSLGDPLAANLRFVVISLVGEENFIDMAPNYSNNFCCGGGGASLQAPFTEARRKFGKMKFDQIMATGAQYCITPCHNCQSQINDLALHYAGKFRAIHLWSLICLALGILAESERRYLGEDLKEVNLPDSNPHLTKN